MSGSVKLKACPFCGGEPAAAAGKPGRLVDRLLLRRDRPAGGKRGGGRGAVEPAGGVDPAGKRRTSNVETPKWRNAKRSNDPTVKRSNGETMKASDYEAMLKAACEGGRQVIDMETCVELCVLGALLPEVRQNTRWKLEYRFAMAWFNRGEGLDARFVRAIEYELAAARLHLGRCGELPPWAADMAKERYKMALPDNGQDGGRES